MKKRLRIIRAMAAMVFILAMMLSMVSCGGGSNTAAEEPDGTDPPTASVSPGVATPEPSASVQPGVPVKTTTDGKTTGSTGTSTGTGKNTGGTTAKTGSTTGTSATETPQASTQPTTTPTPSATKKPETTKTPATPTPTPVPTQKPSTPTPVPTPIPTPFTTPVPATPNPTQGPVKQPDPTPTPHVHEWYTEEVVDVPATEGHFEGGSYDVWVCNQCGAEFTSYAAWEQHAISTGWEHGGFSGDVRSNQHWVEGTPAQTHTVTKCRTCGATQ